MRKGRGWWHEVFWLDFKQLVDMMQQNDVWIFMSNGNIDYDRFLVWMDVVRISDLNDGIRRKFRWLF